MVHERFSLYAGFKYKEYVLVPIQQAAEQIRQNRG